MIDVSDVLVSYVDFKVVALTHVKVFEALLILSFLHLFVIFFFCNVSFQ